MPPRRRVTNTRNSAVNPAGVPLQQEQPAAAAGAPLPPNVATREELLELRNLVQLLVNQTAPPPPPQAPGQDPIQQQPAPSATVPRQTQPPPPPAGLPPQGLGLSYWETMKLMRDMGMEYFIGGTDPVRADDWRRLLERNFDSARCPVEFRPELAVHYLRGDACIWWENVKRSRHAGYVFTWTDFLDEFNRKYFPREVMDQMDSDFLELRQGTKTVREYEQQFSRLRRFSDRDRTEHDAVRRFVRGLRASIRNLCSVRDCVTLVEIVEMAASKEKGLEEEARDLLRTQPRAARGAETQKRPRDNQDSGPIRNHPPCANCGRNHGGTCWKPPLICHGCGETGHIRPQCPRVQGNCNRCGRPGHFSRDCTAQMPVRQQGVQMPVRQQGAQMPVRQQGAQMPVRQQGAQNQGNLPPPPRRQVAGPRAYALADETDAFEGDAEEANAELEGGAPIEGMYSELL